MSSRFIRVAWIILTGGVAGVAVIGWLEAEPPASGGLLALASIIMVVWIGLTIRLLRFRQKPYRFFRRLLAGDYEAGIRSGKRFHDELSHVEDIANQFADRLREYDRLRADRVSVQARALDLILRTSREMMVTADVEKETLVFNPAAQKTLGISGKSWPFEVILKPKDNATFARLFNRSIYGSKLNTEGKCRLKMPGMENPVVLHSLILPLRDRDETVRFALIILDDVQPPSSSPTVTDG